MGVTNVDQLSIAGLPVLPGGVPSTSGAVYFVSNRSGDSGSDGNDGLSTARPLSTLAAAVLKTAASKGDIIIVMPGHSETITTTVTPIAGTAIVGLGWGRNRPAFTGSGAIGVFTCSAANVLLKNIRIIGAAASVLSHIDVSGADFTAEDVEFTCNALPLLSVRATGTTNTHMVFRRCTWIAATGATTDACIDLGTTAGSNAFLIEDCVAMFSTTDDLDQAFIQSSKKTGLGGVIKNLVVSGCVLTVIDFNSSTSAIGDGLITGVQAGFTGGITLSAGIDQGGFIVEATCMGGDAVAGTTGIKFYATTAS